MISRLDLALYLAGTAYLGTSITRGHTTPIMQLIGFVVVTTIIILQVRKLCQVNGKYERTERS